MQVHPYSIWLGLAALASFLATWVVWRRRTAPASWPLLALEVASGVWAGTYALHWASTSLNAQVFWLNATYAGVVVIPLGFLAFALHFTGQGEWLTRRRLLLLSIEPALTFILVWTNPWHRWFHASFQQLDLGRVVLLAWTRGPWFWLNVTFSYSLLLIAVILLARAAASASAPFRGQYGLILAASLFPWAASIVTQFGFNPWPELDLTPLAFSVTGVVFMYTLMFHRLLDLVPVAREHVVESIQDGVMVLDLQNRVVDINPAGLLIARLEKEQILGRPVSEAFAAFPDVLARFVGQETLQEVVHLPGPPERYLELRLDPLEDPGGRRLGWLVVGRDITQAQQRENALLAANQRLKFQFQEIEALQSRLREQAVRDPLTGLYNRRHLDETQPRLFEQAKAQGQPVSLVMVDLDHFKLLNDEYGHAAGDEVLEHLARVLMRFSRERDVICRYGGEEVLVVLPGMPPEAALQRADEWRTTWAALEIPYAEFSLRMTFSAGVSAYPQHGGTFPEALAAADRALYAAKAGGRNRVVLADAAGSG
ncbi:MAG: diguanylate cyclase [Chloroflexi bacterium]|nr:diguanylate cyclase [Chloroflexota bacterium]